jgi:hypothetical protein
MKELRCSTVQDAVAFAKAQKLFGNIIAGRFENATL